MIRPSCGQEIATVYIVSPLVQGRPFNGLTPWYRYSDNGSSSSRPTICFFAVKAQFDTDTVRLWTGIDSISIDSESYDGAGSLLAIGGVEDNFELKSDGLVVSVSGMNEEVLGYALSENYQNRKLTLFLGYVMGGSNEVAGVMTLFSGRMTSLNVVDSTEGVSITVNAESRLIDLKRPSNLRYTKTAKNT